MSRSDTQRSGTAPGIKGRGAADNPANRFEELHYDYDPDTSGEAPDPETRYYKDTSSSIITYNESPDVGFDASINPYRGCEHGCAYCYARPTHEYLGFSAGLDFETRIMVKTNAPDLLRIELASSGWQPQPIAMSGVTDPYQPIERHTRLTRACLEVLRDFRNPVTIVTKSSLITRDSDLLASLSECNAASVLLSVTTLQSELRRFMEPRTSHVYKRLEAIQTLSAEGIPCGVLIAPVIPGLTEHEIPDILEAASRAGASFAGYVVLRLPYNLKKQFSDWLNRNYPDRREKVLNRLREMRLGKLNESAFGDRMRGRGVHAETIRRLYRMGLERTELMDHGPSLSTEAFRNPEKRQLDLFTG